MRKKTSKLLKLSIVVITIVFFMTCITALAEEIVSLNKATVAELMAIEYLEMDEEIATAIVKYRKENGPFKKPQDLLKVPGMTHDWLEEINPVDMDGDIVYDPDAEPALAPSKC